MKKLIFLSFFFFSVLYSCQDFGNLKFIADLPKVLNEVSGIEIPKNDDVIWMLNDHGNKPILFEVSKKGKIQREIKIVAKNHDWEDITSDDIGNIYIGDFGNNRNDRKNLVILKVTKEELQRGEAKIERIAFEYPNQTKYPPKKKQLYFDAEAFFYFKDSLYIFTKSRVKNRFGKTTLYKIPAKKGKHTAELISEFENCADVNCWITAADISEDGTKMVLLSQKNILVFSKFRKDDFFSGNVKIIDLTRFSQKESICFKDNNTLLITDEKGHGSEGNLYELKI